MPEDAEGGGTPEVAALNSRAKHQTWWWHNAREVGALDVGDADEDGLLRGDTPRSAMQTKLEGQHTPARRSIAKHLGERAEPAVSEGASAASSQETAIAASASQEEGVALINSFALAAAAKAAEAADVAAAPLASHAAPGSSSSVVPESTIGHA